MVICKYFLEGFCRFGSRCKFEHTYNDYDSTHTVNSHSYSTQPTYSGTSILRSDVKPAPSINNYDEMQPQVIKTSLNDVVQMAMRDTVQLEKGNQWPLTCYAPVKEYGNLPGWTDHSPEELRWESYNASKNGTFSNCKQAIENLYKTAQERRMDIKIKEKVTRIISNLIHNGPERPPETENLQWTGQSTVFSNTTPSSNASTFGTATSIFTSNISSSSNAGSIFGSAPPAFGSSSFSATPAFGSVFSSSTAFNSAQPTVDSPSPAFGSTRSFGVGPPVSNGTAPIFGTTSNTPQSSFVFSLNTEVKPTDSTINVFTQNSFQTEQNKQRDQGDGIIYSLLDKLTPAELSAFESDTFTYGFIPLKPPPKNLCGL